MGSEYFFHTHDLCVGYHGKPLIRNISIGIRKGEILTLIGPNGSGKSTILKSITKHLAKISGVVFIDKENLHLLSNKETATRISVVLTERIRPEMMTCGEIVASGRYPYTNHFGRLTARDEQIVDESLEKVHAMDLKERDFMQISDGQRQRIMLARAICQEPEIIVLDEPTSFLDIRHKIELLDILRTMSREKGITVILSLHEIDLALKLSDAVMCVKGDTIDSFGPPETVLSEEKIRDLYDITSGTYNLRFGSVELPRPKGAPRGFVLAGGGYGAAMYRKLQKQQIPFATGILHRNDIDYEIACALAQVVISEEAFMPIGPQTREQALTALGNAQWLLDAGTPIGAFNADNRLLLSAAKEQGIAVYTSVDALLGAR